jgi:hypothetical protein
MRGADNKAHMGIFAGEEGVMTGEELTYDYNFDNFGSSAQKCHCGASSCRGFLSKRLNAAEQKQRDKEEIERQRKAAEEAMRNAEAVIQAKKEKNEKGPAWTGWADLNDRAVIEQLKKEKEARDEAAKNSDRARRMALRRGEEVPPLPTPQAPEPAPKPATESKKPARYDSRRNTSGSTVKTPKSTIRRVPSSVASVRPGVRDSEDCSTTPAKRPGHNRTLSAISATRRRPTSSSSATTALLERAISADSNEEELPTPIGKGALDNGNFTTAGAVTDVYDGRETEKTETITTSSSKTTKSKKRKLGNMLKDVAGAVGIGRGNKRAVEVAEASSSNRTPGKLKQSTLSFSKMI